MSEAGENGKRKRRIPQTLRRRALISCDRCKKRRVRCLRSPDSPPEDACQSCIMSGAKCESTLPRKQRIYGSIEKLSLRYRALDALVKGLFPDESTENVETLFRIAETHNIAMPSPNDQSLAQHALNHSPSSSVLDECSPPLSVLNRPLPPPSEQDGDNPFISRPIRVAEEKLIPTQHGVSHYIGPSSSFGFALAVRTMVAERHVTQDQHWPDRADFAALRTSKALEPRASEKLNDEATELDIGGSRRSSPLGEATAARRKEDVLTSFLPAKEVADALVEAFFEQVHPNYLLFHRGTFQLRYESIWTTQLRELEPGWICSIFMVFVFGAQALEHHDKRQAMIFQRRYLSLVQSRLHHLINTTSLVNIQALLLLQLLQHNASERNTAWMLLGCASRMAISLGMHREGATGGFDPIERQVRRRVWWTLYMFEQNLCMILGRPSAIDDIHVNVSLPEEAMLDGGGCIPPDYLDYSLRLTRISSNIMRSIYPPPLSRLQQDELPKIDVTKQLLLELEAWHHSLPPHLCLEGNSLAPKQHRAVLLLHVHYHHTHALVTRPYLLRKVSLEFARQLHRGPRLPALDADGLALSHSCGTSSRLAVTFLHQLATCGLLDGVAWVDVYYAYHGVLVLALDFLARHRDDPDSPEDRARKTAVRNIVDVVCSIKLCPTFHILAQVAVQFARIVGIFDPVPPQCAEPASEQGDIAGIITEWFRHDAQDFSWDFFAVGGYGAGEVSVNSPPWQPPTPYGGTFGKDSLSDEDSTTASLNSSPFASWGGMDYVFTRAGGSSSVGGMRV